MYNDKVNWTKLCGLKMNGWDVGLNCKLGMSWNTNEKTFFGGDDAIAKNGTLVEKKCEFSY